MTEKSALVWLRRDLRATDNAALAHALAEADRVHVTFIFDHDILEHLRDKADRRVEFIWESVRALDETLRKQGGGLIVTHARAVEAIPALAKSLGVSAVYTNHDYEPQALARDASIADALKTMGVGFKTYKDQVIFEKSEVLTQSGGAFSVFTPYKNAWLKRVNDDTFAAYDTSTYKQKSAPTPRQLPTLESMGFQKTNLFELKISVGEAGGQAVFSDFLNRMDHYDEARDFPSVKGPSYLSVHLRFGTVSIRELARAAYTRWKGADSDGAAVWLSELIWRDFYFQILHHHPRVISKSFKPEYDAVQWQNDTHLFQAWCAGQTGYPIVDAGMRQLNQTGYMHNRLRMVVASFLTKDLHVDWQHGERYFAEKLIDFDLSANTGGWQWAASTGCDAQPYFRIFNPISQSEKFDAKGAFIRRYVPELAALSDKDIHAPWLTPALSLKAAGLNLGTDYPYPVVDHATARDKTLAMFKAVKGK